MSSQVKFICVVPFTMDVITDLQRIWAQVPNEQAQGNGGQEKLPQRKWRKPRKGTKSQKGNPPSSSGHWVAIQEQKGIRVYDQIK